MTEDYYVGIDLGTVNSCLAYVDQRGEVKAAYGTDGKDILPSVVLFTDQGKIVGNKAKELSSRDNMNYVVSGFKRQMGTGYTRKINDRSYTPIELSAIILKKLISDFEKTKGFMVRKAVITVPGDYGDIERNATLGAARIVGIEHAELLNESVAAALSYGMGRGNAVNRTIIVYDLGGGTFDATVLKISDGNFRTLSLEGNKNLGGKDWDLQLASIIQKKVLDTAGLSAEEIESDAVFRKDVMYEAEKQKELLTFQDRAVSSIDVNGIPITYTVRREELEEATAWLMAKTIELVGYALRNAKLQMNSIDEIVLVGGATLMPQVMRSLEDAYPSTSIQFFDPEHAVARGAAIYSESVFGKRDINVVSVLSKTFGIMAGIDGQEKVCNILYRNVPLPMENTLMCRPKRDEQKDIEIAVYKSNARTGDDFIDPEKAKLVSKFVFPLPGKVSRGRTRLAVRFAADVEGRLRVSVDCNGKVVDCDLSEGVSLSEKEILEAGSKLGGVV
ncbi:MAG: Hsp70 family protein [Candidatus Methanomethylophilaceae archaeon]